MDNLGFNTKGLSKKKTSEKKKKKKGNLFIKFILFTLIILLILGIVSYILIRKAGSNIEKRLQEIEDSGLGKNWQTISEEAERGIKEENKILEEERGVETDVLSDGEVAIVLDFVSRQQEVGGKSAREGYEFLILNLSIRNQKYEEVTLNSSNFILRDRIYTEYGSVLVDDSEDLNIISGTNNIKARESLNGSMIYEVKKEMSVLEFVYMGDKKLIFEIGSD